MKTRLNAHGSPLQAHLSQNNLIDPHEKSTVCVTLKNRLPIMGGLILFLFGISGRWYLIREPVRGDEAATFLRYAHFPLRFIATTYDLPNNQIFHSMTVHLFYRLMGISEIALRLPAF